MEGFFPCHDNQQCVGGNELCDGGTDCVDGSDEDPMWCTGKADDVIDMQYTIYTYCTVCAIVLSIILNHKISVMS